MNGSLLAIPPLSAVQIPSEFSLEINIAVVFNIVNKDERDYILLSLTVTYILTIYKIKTVAVM